MSTIRSPIRWALAGAALALWPALSSAQSAGSGSAYHEWTNNHRDPKPVCVYKGVMSDAEIELCTGHPVHYDTGAVADRTTAQAPPNTHASG